MNSYWPTEAQEVIAVVDDNDRATWLYLPIAGDPSSLGGHIDAAMREAAQSPQSRADWDAYLASLPPPPAPEPIPLPEKLAAMGVDINELAKLVAATPV